MPTIRRREVVKLKILTVVGARPQFIKAAVVSRQLRQNHTEILVHTGQHYDYNMSDVFFEELSIPKPNYNLGISGGGHGAMTGKMMIALEEVLLSEQPDCLLVYGDTNSTLAAALSAVKLHIPVFHVEAGNRLGTLDNPEEVNRICTDHVSTKLMACTDSAMDFLAKEGLSERSVLVGDPMYDAFLYYQALCPENILATAIDIYDNRIALPDNFNYLTCHRQENTDTDEKIKQILLAMEQLDSPTIYPVHPRNVVQVKRLKEENHFNNTILIKPVGYLASIALVKGAKKVVTDSGGLQREAFFAQKQCVTVFDHIIWPETMCDNRNQLAKPEADDIVSKLSAVQHIDPCYMPFGDGNASRKIVKTLEEYK